MNRHDLLAAIAIVTSATALAAAETNAFAAGHAAMAAKAGGMLEKPNSSKGRIVFVNTQSEMPAANIQLAVKSLADILAKYPVEIVEANPAKAGELKERFRADIAVVVAAEADAPGLIAAPDEGWAVVNVRALTRNLKTIARKMMNGRKKNTPSPLPVDSGWTRPKISSAFSNRQKYLSFVLTRRTICEKNGGKR